MQEKDLKEWFQLGSEIYQQFFNSSREIVWQTLFAQVYIQFAGKYEKNLTECYSKLECLLDDMPDAMRSKASDFNALGKYLLADTDQTKKQANWAYLQKNNLLPGADKVKEWLKAAQSISIETLEEVNLDIALDFCNTYHDAGNKYGNDKLASYYDNLNKWASNQPREAYSLTETKKNLLSYCKYGKDLFLSPYMNRQNVYLYLEDTKQIPNVADKLLGIAQKQLRNTEDDLFWAECESENTIEGCEKYLQKYPRGRHVGEAKRLMDRLREDFFWKECKQQNKLSAYRNYLRQYPYPRGKHSLEAKKLIKDKRKKIGCIVVVGIIGILFILGSVLGYMGINSASNTTCNTEQILQESVFSTTDYNAQLARLQDAINSTNKQQCKDELQGYYNDIELKSIVAELQTQFSKTNGTSSVETYAKYKIMDNGINYITELLQKGEQLSPDNEDIKKYRNEFETIKKKYKIK